MQAYHFKTALRGGAATLAILAALPVYATAANAADAAQASAEDAGTDGNAIIVTGAREAQRAAIRQKEKSLVIADSVGQDDIGRLPDTTVVEAARRIPGVSVDLLTDNNRGRSEVQRASIRGFDAKYNLVTIDGSEIASIDTPALSNGSITRAFNLNLLPASLVGRIDVIKSVTAEYDPQALGGQMDLVTRSAFDSRDPFYMNVSAFGGLDTSSGKAVSSRHPSQRYSAIVSDRFDVGGSRIGLTLAADYQDTWSSSSGETIGVPGAGNQNSAGWTYYGADGTSVSGPSESTSGAVPTRFQYYAFDDHLTHYSVSGKLEFDNNSNFRSSLFGGYFSSKSVETRYEALVTRSSSQIAGTGATGTGAPQNLTSTSGYYPINDVEIGTTYQPIKTSTFILNWKNEYDITDRLKLTLDAAYSRAHGHLYRNMVKYAGDVSVSASSGKGSGVATSAAGASYDASTFVPSLAFDDPSYISSASNYEAMYFRYINFDEKDTVFDVHPTLSWNADAQDQGLGLRAGVRFTQNKLSYRENYVEYDPTDPSDYTLDAASTRNLAVSAWGTSVPIISRTTANQLLADNLSDFTSIDETTANNANQFDFREQTKAAFVQALYQQGPLKASAGLRFERTDNLTGSNEQVSNGVYDAVTDKSHYSAVLPSALVRYEIDDNLIAHAAISKTLGRPDPSAYGPIAKVGQPSTSAGTISVTLGNPDIKPRKAMNYDAALDFYFDNHNSMVSLQYFHKDLKNEFYDRVYSGDYEYDGTTYTATFTQVTNGAKASVNGIEVNFQKDKLPILPAGWGDIGFGANYTRIWTDYTILDSAGAARSLNNLINQPTYIANASVFYNLDRLHLALSFNAQGKTLFETGYYAWQDTYVMPRQQLDLTARFDVTPRITVMFEGANLTGSRFRSAMGTHQELEADDYNIGSQLWGGVTFKF